MGQKMKGSQNDQKHNSQQSAGKVMVSVYWDANGIIFINYRILYGVISSFGGRNCEKTSPNVAKMAKLPQLHFEMLQNPPYSLNLATSEYYLYANLKKMLARTILQ